MQEVIVNPGQAVVTQFGVYQHWSLVSDRFCAKGKPMLISATKRTGTVLEEEWDTVTGGKHTYVADLQPVQEVAAVLAQARSQIAKWKYSVDSRNCEHFVNWTFGHGMASKQVAAGATGAVLGAAAVAAFAENPTWVKLLGVAVAVGGLAVVGAKAVEAVQGKDDAGMPA